jgi:serine phosphatase RsbU (regulator of sigma subunit)
MVNAHADVGQPHEEISRRAYAKWLARCQTWDRQLQDWLEAESEFTLEREVKERIVALLAERREAERRLIAEHSVSNILAGAVTLLDAVPKLMQAICECLDWDVGVVWMLDRNAKLLRCVEVWHRPQVDVAAFEQDNCLRTISPGIGMPGRVWASESIVWMPDVTTDADFQRGSVAARAGLRGAIGFPLRSDGEFIGVLEFFSREVREPDEQVTEMMTSIAHHISQFVERRSAERRLIREEADRRIARQIQQGLLPNTMPRLPGFQICGRSAMANTVGGDWFDFIPLSVEGRECLGVALADACGHGIAAALLAVQTRAYLRSLALTCSDVGILLDFVNQRLTIDMVSDHFVTAFLLSLDPHARSLIWASAGHMPGYILDSKGQTKAVLPSTGFPLGIDLANKFPTSTVSVEEGDLFLVITDGITEAASPDGDLFGMERTLHLVRQHRQERPDEILTAIFDAVGKFCNYEFHDDLTAVIIKVESAA